MNQAAKRLLLVGWVVLATAVPACADSWWTVETKHFVIRFPDEKTQIVLKDVTDTANGFSR